ncbi:MAG: glycine--tRNA ligase subunit beta, partial [Anaerolineae bacterium]|nr:glycine--tRNA ligase subunit beta [Anaerolineae bacterium]
VIYHQLSELAESVGGVVLEDDNLLEEVTNLVETPTAVLCSFEKRYLTLPQELLVAVMQKHQRYFPILDSRGRITSNFITVRNGGRENIEIVRQGNEAVIKARYADAQYFYNRDCRTTLGSFRVKLKTLVFQEQLGSMADKSDRLVILAPWLADFFMLPNDEMDDLVRAAYLCKADLATNLVVEMTSLQGVMGREYARRSGESSAVALAIMEHYLPRYAEDALPTSNPGIVLALADRMDNLAGLFAVGLEPTGSTDPYGLRRDAASIIRLLQAQEMPFPLRPALEKAGAGLPVEMSPSALEHVIDFVKTRLRVSLRDEGFAFDVVEAVLAFWGDNPYVARELAQQLSLWVEMDNWPNLLQNYARCVRITRDITSYPLNSAYLTEPAERDLWQKLQELNSQLSVRDKDNINTLLEQFTPMVPLIEKFFNEVMVMVDDVPVRQARLALLLNIAELPVGLVDLSQLESF